MVRREAYINKIRELGYTFKAQQKRTYLYRKSGTTEYISVPMREYIEEDTIRITLRQKGVSQKEIDTFIASAKS